MFVSLAHVPVQLGPSEHLPLPPVGYQLVRDPITGHFLLIPATNIGKDTLANKMGNSAHLWRKTGICSLYECARFQSEMLFLFYHPPFSLGRVKTSLAVNCKVFGHFVMGFFYQSVHKMADAWQWAAFGFVGTTSYMHGALQTKSAWDIAIFHVF